MRKKPNEPEMDVVEVNNNQNQSLIVLPLPLLPLDQNPAAIYLASLRRSGQVTMRGSLNMIAQLISGGSHDALSLAWGQLRYQHTVAIRAQLSERYSPATTNKMLSALRRVLKEAWRLNQIGSEEYQRAVDLKNVRGTRLPAGRALKDGEVTNLLQVCLADKHPAGKRDLAILALLYASGLRRSEVVKLDLVHYNKNENCVKVKAGKGDKDRMVYLGEGLDKPMMAWIALRGDEPGPLFCPISWKGRLLFPRRLTDQSIAYILKHRVKQAGLTETASPHDFRRTFISNLLDMGADIVTVQHLAGHASVTTTARYDRRGDETRKKAARLIKVPLADND